MLKRRRNVKRLSQEETKKVIRARIELNHLFLWNTYKKQESWSAIASKAGVNLDVVALKKKWESLENTYKKLVESPVNTEGRWSVDNWPYFDDMHEWASGRQNIQPPYLLSTEYGPNTSYMLENEENQEELQEVMLIESEEFGPYSSESCPSVQSTSSISSRGKSTRKKRKKNPLKEEKVSEIDERKISLEEEEITETDERKTPLEEEEEMTEIDERETPLEEEEEMTEIDERKTLLEEEEEMIEIDERKAPSEEEKITEIDERKTPLKEMHESDRTRNRLQEMLENSRIMEKKINVLYKGISIIFKEKYNIILEESDSD